MITFADALDIVLSRTSRPGPATRVPLAEATGLILATDVHADRDIPPFDRAAMDGFAVRAEDLAALPATLRVVGGVSAGKLPGEAVGSGDAAEIMTVAPVPRGADAVVQVEWTSGFGRSTVTVMKAVSPGENLSPRGEIAREGQRLLSAGTRIREEEIAILAAVGLDPTPVWTTPTAAVISTGDEIVAASGSPSAVQIRDSNGPVLFSLLRRLGVVPVDLGRVPDDPTALRAVLSSGLDHDFLIVTGGVSAGTRDFVRDALVSLGVEIHFAGVAIKPGRPTVFGTRGRCAIFGLPGNPVSALVVARVLIVPSVNARLGLADPRPRIVPARLEEPLRKKPDRLWFVHGRLDLGRGPSVVPLGSLGSADIVTAARGNCLVLAPQGESLFEAGQTVEVVVWDRVFG